MMFKNLLVIKEQLPYDHHVLQFAKSLKFLGAEEITLASHLLPHPEKRHEKYDPEVVSKDLEDLKEMGYTLESMDLEGLPVEKVHDLVEYMEPYDSLILAGAKVSSIGKRIFDSEFAYELIQMPSKPILLVRVKEEEDGSFTSIPQDGLNEMSHVLFPTDFSENAYHAFTYLEKMVEKGLKKVTLMHIQDIAKISPYLDYRIIEFNQIDRDRLDALRKRLEEKGDVEVEVVLEIGRPFREINRAIDEKHFDLVILGRQGKGIMMDLFIGSNSNNLARRAKTSVLLIPRAEEK